MSYWLPICSVAQAVLDLMTLCALGCEGPGTWGFHHPSLKSLPSVSPAILSFLTVV